MLYSTPTVFLGLAVLGSSHMIMNTPVPYGKSTLNNSPLLADGTDFPCKQRTGVYTAESSSTPMAIGSSQPLSFTGSATHGGGSCQISITYDKAPTKSSTFKVIHSIVGGCPIQGVAGNNGDNADAADPSTYSFKIPSSLPTGEATLAWTWFNKVGNREMYMNCAPVTIGAGNAKRDDEGLEARNITQLMERDTAAFDALPDMFVANIGNGCGTQQTSDLVFPDPGDSVESLGTATASGVTMGPTGSCAAATGSSGAGATSAASAVQTSAAPVASSVAASSAPAASGGVFATVASSAPVASASAAAPVASGAVASQASSASTPASTGTTGSGSAIAAGTACTTEGMWNCIGGTSFQQCASGVWSAVEPVAGGTTCTAGQSTSFTVKAIAAKAIAARHMAKHKRAIRFSQDHVRRFNPENSHA